MGKTVRVRRYEIGSGKPGVIVPIVDRSGEAIVASARRLAELDGVDMVEWRADFFDEVFHLAKVEELLERLCAALDEIPLLFTFRTAAEGGERPADRATYTSLNKAVAESGMADLIDVEMFSLGEDTALENVEAIHRAGVPVVGSNHDFGGTPARKELVRRLCRMGELDADILKIAVMPHTTEDVLTLLAATNEVRERHTDRPLITMSMGDKGVISRLAGEVFGSAMTFGAAGAASAPGQVPVARLAEALEVLHRVLP